MRKDKPVTMREVAIETPDEISLNGYLFETKDAKSLTVLHAATGVPATYYSDFARWHSETNQRHVLIYEYRDSLLRNPEQLKQSKTSMADWGLIDQVAALDYMLERYPKLEVETIGHSLGGFCIPFHINADKIKVHRAINSGLAYWRQHPWHFTAQVIMFWFLVGPVLTKIMGYMPGQLLGMKTHLPARVYWQWRKWCTNEKFHEIEWGKELPQPDLQRFRGDLKIFTATDDEVIPSARVKALTRFFPATNSTSITEIDARDFGIKKIGHITIFSKKCSNVWPLLVE